MTMINSARPVPARGISIVSVLAVLVLLIALGFLASTYKRWEGQPPEVVFDRDFQALSRTPALALAVEDAGSGLRQVTIVLKQGDEEVVLAEDSFAGRNAGNSRRYDLGALIAEKHSIQDGPASLSISASDYAFRNFLRGNRTELTKDFEFDLYPPRLEVLSGQHYINQGGSQAVVYRVSEDAETSGVQVGPHFFPGYPANLPDPDIHFALFAYAYDLPADTRASVTARDAAGNRVVLEPWQRIFPRTFRNRTIALDDGFLQKVVSEIMPRSPGIQEQGGLLETFLEINNTLRRQNHETIRQMSSESPGRFLWDGAFLQLSNSQVESLFADRRTYIYRGNEVDRQDHIGFDLSVVQRYPIEAANDGTVLLADYFGIYGNTVVIDHGAGLLSLYGHMNSIDVQAGQAVKKKDILGRSGETGLAGGDHLHYGLFLHGVPVNPTEWWDPKWVQEQVLDRLKPFS